MTRGITEPEQAWLSRLSAASDPRPPWTAAKREAREARNQYICRLYSEGVPVPEIASAAGLSTHAIVAVVRKARSEGQTVIRPRAARARTSEAYRRRLTDDELTLLRALDSQVPRQRNGRRFMYGDEGKALLAEVIRLRSDRVALQTIADVLDVSRQSIHSMTRNVTEALTDEAIPVSS